jgi:hypothetical protein
MQMSSQLYATAALPPREKVPGAYWVVGCVGHRAGLETKIFDNSGNQTPTVQPVALRYTD